MKGSRLSGKGTWKNGLVGCLCLIWLGLLLSACLGSDEGGGDITGNPTPDLVATEVAVQKAALATLTAEAPTPATAPVITPTLQTTSDTLPAVTATLTSTSVSPPPVSPTTSTTAPDPRCQVITSGLNLRPGPGTIFDPPLAALTNGAELVPRAFFPSGFPGGQWLEVQATTGQIGWISADAQLVNCNIPFTTLPVGIAPPTPTSSPTPTPTLTPTSPPSPTPTPILVAVVPVDGADDNNFLQGRRVILPGIAPQQVTIPPVFRNRISFGIEAYDIRFGTRDGDGIEQINITITYSSDEGDIEVHHEVEQQASFCAFGTGEPICNAWDFAGNAYRWPNGYPILNGTYQVAFDITPRQGDITQWRWRFEVEGVETGTPPGAGNVVAEIVQTGLGTNSSLVTNGLVFQVRAYHVGYGNSDGAGIDGVEMAIFDDQGRVVYQNTETTPRYCAFGGGEPDCNVLPLEQIDSGFYTLQAIAYAEDGQSAMVSTQIEIQDQY